MDVIKPTSFYIKRDGGKPRVIAVMSDGNENPWGNAETERGLKSCLTRYAKEYGFVVTGETAQPAVKSIKAQDVKPGDKIKIDAYMHLEVDRVYSHKLADGDTAYTFYNKSGRHVWNRHNEELVLA